MPTAPTTSFANDIAPIFAPYRSNMLWRFDLTDYDQVVANAKLIQSFISGGVNVRMPPANYGNALTDQQQALFQTWINEGYPP